jgi:uncharacterized membrane protein
VLLILFILGGAIAGAWVGDDFGAGAAGAAIGWLAHRSLQQARELARLRADLESALLEAPSRSVKPDAATLTPQPSEAAASAATAATPSPVHTAPAAEGPAVAIRAGDDSIRIDKPPGTEVDSLWGDVAPTERPVQPPPRRAPAPAADLLAPLRRWLFGGNTIVKLGVGILFIGLAFLAKFASEHVHVPVEFRLAGVGAAALVLLAFGWRLRHTRAQYAQVLQGGAVAVLYLTLFVAFRFFDVLSVGPAFACMVLVAALAAALAVLQDARALAVIGALGGFATPLLVSTGSGNHIALFGYYLVLDLGIAFVAWYKHWRLLNLIGFFATFLVGTTWGVLKYQSEHYASSQAFLIAYFLLFTLILLLPARQSMRQTNSDSADAPADATSAAARGDAWVNGSLLFGLPTITFVLQHALVRHTEYGSALSALALAAFYVLQAAWMRARPQLAVTFEASLAIGAIFLTLVIPFALDARSTAGAWALEGAGLVWLGFRQQRLAPRAFGYLLLLLSGGAMMWAGQRHGAPTGWLNAYLFNGLMAAAASIAAAFFVSRNFATGAAPLGEAAAARPDPTARTPQLSGRATGTLGGTEAVAEPLLIGWGVLWLLGTAASQLDALVPSKLQPAAWLVAVSAMALLCTALHVRLAWRNVAWPALGHAPAMALAVAFAALFFDGPLQHGGWWAWPLAALTHLLVLWHAAPAWTVRLQGLVHTLGALVLAALGALQGRHVTGGWGDAASAWSWLGWLVVPAVLLLWLPLENAARRWPLRAAPAAYQRDASAVLALGLLLWTLLANLVSNGSARPLPHLPLVNPLDLGIGVALLAAWRWTQRGAALPLFAGREAWPSAALGVAGFVWLNAMLVRAFHHYGDVPYRLNAWTASLAVQTGLTLLWSSTALVLMWFSARRAARVPWLVGAVLLGAVVLKLMLVDLSGTGTVTRIVSFIGVGVLMLVIGYVAPLPAAAPATATPRMHKESGDGV